MTDDTGRADWPAIADIAAIVKCPGCDAYVRPAEAFERPHDPAYHLVTRKPLKATAARP